MNILIAPDKFKGTLSAKDVCEAVKRGLVSVFPDVQITCMPLADGGEGSIDVLTEALDLNPVKVKNVCSPNWGAVDAEYGLSKDGGVAVIEMARASGLELLTESERDVLKTTTFGTGELIAHAIERKARKIILTVGGSATNDGGTGMAAALGYRFYNARNENDFVPVGGTLQDITRIDFMHPDFAYGAVKFTVLTDVTNPLFGPQGAAYVYAPQKGAKPADLSVLDNGLRHLAEVIRRDLKHDVSVIPGGGAAGGLGAGAVAFLNAELKTGCSTIMEYAHFDEALSKCDVVITGEGKIDKQSAFGKVVGEVARRARQSGKIVLAVAGDCDLTPNQVRDLGIERVFALTSLADPQVARKNAAALLEQLVAHQVVLLCHV